MRISARLICVLGVLVSASNATAATITATITADNHYALYSGAQDGSFLATVGGNELGVHGAPGRYNWSMAESYDFSTDQPFLYLAAWSDGHVAQGVLAELAVDELSLLSGNAAWTVFATGIDKDDNDPYPTETEMGVQITRANAVGWEPAAVGGNNGVAPWGRISGVSQEARWMWLASPDRTNAFHPGLDHDEYLIFRTAVPEPSSLLLLVVGGLATCRAARRRCVKSS